MGLQSSLTAMCFNLHNVLNFSQTDAPTLFRVTSFDGTNRRRWTSQRPQTLKWLGTTPPARIRLSAYDDFANPSIIDPAWEVTGDVIDCGFPDAYLNATWFRMVNVDLRFNNNHAINAVRWVHIMHLGTYADSIGFFLPAFPP